MDRSLRIKRIVVTKEWWLVMGKKSGKKGLVVSSAKIVFSCICVSEIVRKLSYANQFVGAKKSCTTFTLRAS